MFFASDNAAPVPPQFIEAMERANTGYAMAYGNDPETLALRDRLRELFEAPEAEVFLVSVGTAANALALACLCQPWQAVFCHTHAHVAEDECGAPEFFTHGAKLVLVDGADGRMAPEALRAALAATGGSVHGVQRGALTLTNVTEAGTVYTPDQIAELAAIAHAAGCPVHLDGARFANALAATGATPAQMTWQAGVDLLSLGGTKNGLIGVEAVVLFDPARAWEFQLRRKRAGHLASKQRFMAAQMAAWLEDGLWLSLAEQANAMGARLAEGLARLPGVTLRHPVEANILFPEWPEGTEARLQAAGAVYYPFPAPPGREAGRLVTSWSTTEADVDAFLAALRG